MKSKVVSLILYVVVFGFSSEAQKSTQYNLIQLLQEHKLVTYPHQETQALDDPDKSAITSKGIVWLEGVNFSQGKIDIDLRGKDIFLKSFLGIAFHGVDTITYEVIYFRPFNFRHTDTARRKWSVQYMSMPKYNYAVLRKEHPQMYENAVTPVPKADEWFHATIVVNKNQIIGYVNQSAEPSLRVSTLNDRVDGKIGLWSDELSGDFANLTITQ